ncbi:VWA domain-containing protein [Paracholeplasma manati]|uniref:VWA domain-containing protein n=1 Tax=Paracholeplasma manati TaxID=591373 RepID=A0ABT2YBM8_9MOLU|nr:VWA domain-containing protein [Paracholeplasma manati]MCV2231903.1 VWA domain-containing protein [Paracholeplasma manati]MDG0889151.1 VWA domain-containing protein [Paracholeplasma manati]
MKKALLGVLIALLFTLSGCGAYGPYEDYPSYQNGETYSEITENPFIRTMDMPVSTFSVDVDTASYSNIRRMIQDGYLPEKDAVRIEEMVNYFQYDIAGTTENEKIHIHSEYSYAPWAPEHGLLMVGLKTQDIEYNTSLPMNLVFLIDVSGSMYSSDKLPLLKQSLGILVENLRPTDRISIVTYAGSAKIALEGGDATEQADILSVIQGLEAGGSTAGASGISLAYEVASRNFIDGGNNRIILATDGDFNVGMNSVSDLEDFIESKKATGVFFSVLGFGTGNIRDDIMESLADHGNGVYYYIDSIKEAEKVFIHQLGGSMIMVAKDVKLQIEFNPVLVKGYRLIGYENRVLDYDDFQNDFKDAGDMGAGHVVIAFYEIIHADSDETIPSLTFDPVEVLKYTGENHLDELLTLSIRYKEPTDDTSMLIEKIILGSTYTDTYSTEFGFASAVVEFGLLLRNSIYKSNASYTAVIERATLALDFDPHDYRSEFIELVMAAKNLSYKD